MAIRVAATRPELRHLLKAGLLVAALKSVPLVWDVNGVTVRVTNTPKVNKAGQLEVVVDAPGVALNNPYLFVNPPLLVPDGGTWVDEEGNENKTFVEDAAEAARVIIAQAVGVA